MTYSIWQQCDAQAVVLADAVESAPAAVQAGGANLSRGLINGVQIRVNTADALNTTVICRLYSDAAETQLLYEESFDLSVANVGAEVHDVGTLTTPLPFYETPFFALKAPKGGAGRTFTVTYMVEIFS